MMTFLVAFIPSGQFWIRELIDDSHCGKDYMMYHYIFANITMFANNLYWLFRGKENRAATNFVIIFFLFSKFWKIYEIVGINLQP